MFQYFKEYFDFKTLGLTLGLVIIGLMSIYSATFDINNAANFYRQTMWAGLGLVSMAVMAILPIRTIQRLAFVAYGIVMGVLVIVLIVGSTVKGSKSWFGVIGMGGQPSEFAKVTTILAVAAYLARTEVSISELRHLLVTLGLFLLPMGLIMLQPDLGTTIVFFCVLLPVLYWAGVSDFILVSIIVPFVVALGALFGTTQFLLAAAACGAILFYFRRNRFGVAVAFGIALAVGLSVQVMYERLPAYQQKRIATFLNPEADPLGAGYNVVQSKIAIGSGGLAGKGYLHGTQTQLNYIPEQWTDFIFCVPGEEFGFIGSVIVLGLFAALVFHGISIAGISKNRFGSIGAIGITTVIITHVAVNIGMALGLMPVIGIPLPLLSYGGSALVADMAMAGLLMNFYTNRKEH